MAKRRVKSSGLDPVAGDQTFSQADILRSIGNLANLANTEETPNLAGTAQPTAEQPVSQFPQGSAPYVPLPQGSAPPVPQEQFNVPGMSQGMPPGMESVGNLSSLESNEPGLVSGAGADVYLPEDENGDLPDPLEFLRSRLEQDPSLAEHLPQETLELLQQTAPAPEQPFLSDQQEQIPPPKEDVQTMSDTALPPAVERVLESGTIDDIQEGDIPSEGLGAVSGSVEQMQSDQKLSQVASNLLGSKMGDLPIEFWEHSAMMENIFTKEEANLDVREKEYLSNIQTGELTNFDKVAIGVALVAPVLIGLAYGKEGFVSAVSGGISGGLKGFSGAMTEQGKLKTKSLEGLEKVQKERKEINLSRANLKKELATKIENPVLRKLLKNYDVVDVQTDEQGDPKAVFGKDAIAVGENIGISAQDEDKALYYNADLLRDDGDAANFKTAIKDGRIALSKTRDANKTIDDVVEIMELIKTKHPKLMNAITQKMQPILMGGDYSAIPYPLRALTIEVIDNDGNIKEVQALPLLKQKTTAMQDVYNKEYLGGNRLTANLQDHWEDVFPDTTAVSTWLKSDFNTMQNEAEEFKSILNQRAVENLVGEGFLRKPLEDILKVSRRKYLKSPNANNEDMKDVEQDLGGYQKLINKSKSKSEYEEYQKNLKKIIKKK